MPVIQDPRQNPRNEKDFGIVYIEEVFNIPGGSDNNPPGHYFYKKQTDPDNDLQSSRYYPQGFPVIVTGEAHGHIDPQVIEHYQVIFPNLQSNIILEVGFDSNINLDNEYPMAAYLHKAISHGESTPPVGRGLKKFRQGNEYIYQQDPFDIGGLLKYNNTSSSAKV